MDELIKQNINIDAIITDIPYGTTNCKWDSVIPFDEMWKRLKLLKTKNTPIILFGSEPFSSALRMSNIKNYKYDWYWYKNQPSGALNAKKQPMRAIENICVFYSNQCLYNPQMIERTEEELKRLSKKSTYTSSSEIYNNHWTNTRNRNDNKLKYPNNVLEIKTVFNRSKEKLPHPNQKPVELMKYLVETYTKENDTILDFTMGSGTTSIACIKTNRNFIGIENDDTYFDVCKNRVNTYINDNNLQDANVEIAE